MASASIETRGQSLTNSDTKKMFARSLVYILILVLSFHASNTFLVRATTYPDSTGKYLVQNNYLDPISSQELTVDIYTEQGGQGRNVPIGAYRIGDTIKIFILVSQDCTLEEDLITPDGSVEVRMKGPVTAGTITDYVDTQYPIGKWALTVKAQEDAVFASDKAAFEVIDKEPYTPPKTRPFELGNITTIGETRFDGKVVNVYRYPVGYVHGWEILVEKVYFGPDIRNLTVSTQLTDISRSQGYPPGYLDYNITLGDQVQVYGLVSEDGNRNISVTVNGFENYYIKTLKALYESPEIILFTREVFTHNLTAKIDGIAIPGYQSATITNVTWNWGDGQTSDQEFPATHAYTAPGSYVILIRAFQSDGLSTGNSLSITLAMNSISEYANRTISESKTGNLTRTEATTKMETSYEAYLVVIILAVVLASIVVIRLRMRKLSKSNRPNQDG